VPDLTVTGPDRLALASALADIRAGTGLSQAAFGARVGHHQTWVSKVEDGRILPDDDAIRAWCEAGGASPGMVLLLAPRARIEARSVRAAYQQAGGGAGYQQALGVLERETLVKRKFMPAMVPAEVQVPAYALEVLHNATGPGVTAGASDEDIAAIVAQRMANQASLYEEGRLVDVVVLESVLRHPLASPAAMRAQLGRLLAVDGIPGLEFGIIPFGRVLPVTPMTGFLIFDESHVTIESAAGPTDLTGEEWVGRYLGWFGLLRDISVHGDDAAALVHAALERYR
jgi:transcriptional regulator with XRE-family HTH domain